MLLAVTLIRTHPSTSMWLHLTLLSRLFFTVPLSTLLEEMQLRPSTDVVPVSEALDLLAESIP
jgi:hypothetical protein